LKDWKAERGKNGNAAFRLPNNLRFAARVTSAYSTLFRPPIPVYH